PLLGGLADRCLEVEGGAGEDLVGPPAFEGDAQALDADLACLLQASEMVDLLRIEIADDERRVARGYDLQAGEVLLEQRHDALLPLRMHVGVDLVDQNEGCLLLRVLRLAVDLEHPLQERAHPTEDRTGALAQGVDRHLAVLRGDEHLPSLAVNAAEAVLPPGSEIRSEEHTS